MVPRIFIALDQEAKHIAEAQQPKNIKFSVLTGFKNLVNPKWQSEKNKKGIIKTIPYKNVLFVI